MIMGCMNSGEPRCRFAKLLTQRRFVALVDRAQQVIQQVRPSVGAIPLGNGRHRQSDGGANLRQCAAMQRSTSFVSEELEQQTC